VDEVRRTSSSECREALWGVARAREEGQFATVVCTGSETSVL